MSLFHGALAPVQSLARPLRALLFSATGLAACLPFGTAEAAQTKSWVVNWFTQATYSQDGDCAGGLSPTLEEVYRRNLKEIGKSAPEIDAIMNDFHASASTPQVREILTNRGRIDGKPTNVYENPTSVSDPHPHLIQGRYALGFNLDGKGSATTNGFEDPETHEQGVNNQHFRVLGCVRSHRAMPPDHPTHFAYVWENLRENMPAWLITLSGEDLTKDGDVTVIFDRALNHATTNANGVTRANATFRIDPSPRSHNVLHGKLVNGVVTTGEAPDFHMVADPFFIAEFNLRKTHLRLNLKPDGNLEGIIGGYQEWLPMYFMYAIGGFNSESDVGTDYPGIFYALRQGADAYPDAKTGQNTHISTAYRIEAVPAFAAAVDDAKTSKTAEAAGPIRTSQAR